MLDKCYQSEPSFLMEVAAHFAATDVEAARIAACALHVISEDPFVLDGPDIDKALALVIHKIAQQDYPPVSHSEGLGDHST